MELYYGLNNKQEECCSEAEVWADYSNVQLQSYSALFKTNLSQTIVFSAKFQLISIFRFPYLEKPRPKKKQPIKLRDASEFDHEIPEMSPVQQSSYVDETINQTNKAVSSYILLNLLRIFTSFYCSVSFIQKSM